MSSVNRSAWHRWFGVLGAVVVAAVCVSAVAASAKTARKPAVNKFEALGKYWFGSNWRASIGTKADRKLPPVVFGWINTDTGVQARPYITNEAQLAAWMINNELGGIHGHPLVLKTCDTASVEANGQTCGQQFLSDPAIKMVIEGIDGVGGTSLHAAMAGSSDALIAGVATGPYDIGAPNTWALSPSRYLGAALWSYLKRTHKTNVAYLTPNIPLLVSAYQQASSQAAAFHVKLTPVYYDPTATDITPTLIAANLKQYQFVYVVVTNAGTCAPVISGFKSLGITGHVPVMVNSGCFGPAVVQQFGDYAPWEYYWYGPNPLAQDEPGSQVQSYLAAVKADHQRAMAAAEPNSGPIALGQVLYAARLLNGIGYKASRSRILDSLPSDEDPMFMGPPAEKFNSYAGLPNVGAVTLTLWQYQGKDKWKQLNGGRFVTAPHS